MSYHPHPPPDEAVNKQLWLSVWMVLMQQHLLTSASVLTNGGKKEENQEFKTLT